MFNRFIIKFKSFSWIWNMSQKLKKIEKKEVSNFTDMNNFHTLHVVDRVSETQHEVTENVTYKLSDQRVKRLNVFAPGRSGN